MHIQLLFLVLMVLLADNLQASPSADRDTAIAEAKKNCRDCYGGTVEGLLAAVSTLENIQQSEKLDKEALKVLADAYGQLAYGYFDEGSAERPKFAEKQSTLYAELAQDSCFDMDSQYRYATTLQGKEALEALEPVLEQRGILFRAAWAKANYLIHDTKEVEKGLEALKFAFAFATDGQKTQYGRQQADVLAHYGDTAAAEEVKRQIAEIKQRVEEEKH